MVKIQKGLTMSCFFHIHFCCFFLLFLQHLNPAPLQFMKLLMLLLVLNTMPSTSDTQGKCTGKVDKHGHTDEKGAAHF